MPQMAPLWWLTLMLTFNLMLSTLMCMLYFNKKIKMNTINKLKKKEMNWKW
uniref:ATP synthase F0 subunit 8 n=1 Tax=Centrotypus laticornis TaxID=2980484 RepID=UPI0028FCBAEA|nr:ATP synthase F0 subunit 8 [Centrotypus laticornis]UXF57634.1 ATP synthase F0 subunit 8 [Centrotypus laticornis]